MKHASLFSGIGGFDLAAQWMGWANVFQVEIDPFCRRVLEKNFPDTVRYSDIRQFDGNPYRNQIDIISGGWPCQPFSTANKSRKGTADSRFLFPEMLRIIREIRPRFVLGENVEGFIPLGLDDVAASLEREGYCVEPHVIPASSVGATHRRNRCWILCSLEELSAADAVAERCSPTDQASATVAPLRSLEYDDWFPMQVWESPPPSGTSFCGMDDGIPSRVDQLAALGNAVVPQVVYVIFRALSKSLSARQQ